MIYTVLFKDASTASCKANDPQEAYHLNVLIKPIEAIYDVSNRLLYTEFTLNFTTTDGATKLP